MVFMNNPAYLDAYEKANEVIKRLPYSGSSMVDTDDVVKIVGDYAKYNISIFTADFAPLGNEISECGALTSIIAKPQENRLGEARIYLNAKYDLKFRRFSLVHELGHLMTGKNNFKEGYFFASAHIQYNLTYLDDKETEGNKAFENEQIANVFALSVLMPKEVFERKMNLDDETLCAIFGVSMEALNSRKILLREGR